MYQGCKVTKSSHLPICYFLALLWAHPILHVSMIRVKALLLLQGFMMYYFINLLPMNIMLYVTRTLLIMYHMLFRFKSNTNHWHTNCAYSTRHIISKYSAALWLLRSIARRRPQRLGFELGLPFDIRYRKVALVQLSIQVVLFSAVSTLPLKFYIHALCFILIAVNFSCFTVYFNEIFFVITLKGDC